MLRTEERILGSITQHFVVLRFAATIKVFTM